MMEHIAVDLDDCVLDFCGGIRSAIKTEYGVDVPEFNDWNLHPILDPILGESWWSWMKRREWLWAGFPAIEGAIGTLELLRNDGHYLELLTSKPRWAEHNTYKWIGRWRPPFQRITIVSPDHRKVNFTDASILIDDKLGNLEHFVESGNGRIGILFERSHNKNLVVPSGIIKLDSWSKIREYINGR